MIQNELLQPFIGKIVLVTSNGTQPAEKWQTERELCLMNQSKIDSPEYCMREILPNEVIIEFDASSEINLSVVQKESDIWISKLATLLKSEGWSFIRTSHKGKSDHLRLYFDDLIKYPDRVIEQYKKLSTKKLIEQIGFESDILTVDESFCKASERLVPMAGKPHWKSKWNGEIERVVDQHEGKAFEVRKELIDEIEKKTLESLKRDSMQIRPLGSFTSNEQNLLHWLTINFRSSKRNDCFLALSGYCHRIGMEEQEFTDLLSNCLNQMGASEYMSDYISRIPLTFAKDPMQVAVWHYIQSLSDEPTQTYDELKKCFPGEFDSDTPRERILMAASLSTDPSKLGKMVGNLISHTRNIFYRPQFDDIVEVVLYQSEEDKDKGIFKTQVNVVDTDRLKNHIMFVIDFYTITPGTAKKPPEEVPVGISIPTVKTLMKNEEFLKSLRVLDTVLNRPYLYKKGNTLETAFEGYDDHTNLFFTPNTPKIEQVSVADAKAELNKILGGFCFENQEAKEMAIAYILTPALRGLYDDKRERSPCFAIIANRPGAGKDHLAGVRHLIYTGGEAFATAIATSERSNNEEWRKKFTSILMEGDTLFHSQNNVGMLNNPVFEGLITSKEHTDRLLGGNTTKKIDNVLDLSFSANTGLKWNPDMSRRLRTISLFFADEDVNARVYEIRDLHSYIRLKRGFLLSCIYALIKDWYEKDRPCRKDKVYTSFPVWGEMCAAIMDYHQLGNPIVFQEEDELSGNDDDRVMTELYKFMVLWQGNKDKPDITSSVIMEAVAEYHSLVEERQDHVYGYDEINSEHMQKINLDNPKSKIRFGIMIKKYRGRIMNGIKFKVVEKNTRANRWLYSFEPLIKKNNEEK